MRGEEQSFQKTAIDLKKITSQLWNPPQFHIECPSSDDRPSDAEPPAMVFWQKQIDAGLRFPVCPFLSDLSRLYQIPINQLHPSSIRRALFFHILLREHGLADTSRLFHICHGVKVIGVFYCFSTKAESPAHFYGQIPSVGSGWLKKYFFVRPLSGHGWPFREVRWHVKLREIHTPSVDNLTKHEWSVLAAISASFDEKHVCMLRVVTDVNALIYHGLFLHQNWSVDMGNPNANAYPFLSFFLTVTPDKDELAMLCLICVGIDFYVLLSYQQCLFLLSFQHCFGKRSLQS